jgi:multidrug efflux pump subunit AcrB
MLILLMIQLQRFSRMLLALFMAPFGLPGIVLAMLPTRTPMGFVALLGVIALAGMIIRNAVILISEVDNNLAQGMTSCEAIVAAAEHRSRPIILTACAAILGMIPISHQVFGADGLCHYRRTSRGHAGHADGIACFIEPAARQREGCNKQK